MDVNTNIKRQFLAGKEIKRSLFADDATFITDGSNEREEFMQETQHTQQTATRTAQNQDKKTT